MPRLALTDRFCIGAKASGQQPQTDYFDSKCPGLALRVSETGVKSWTLLFSDPGSGKRARMTLGQYPALPLAVARTKAIEARGHIEEGTDPRTIKQHHGASQITVAEIFQRYISDPEKLKLRSLHEIRRRFRRDILPTIGHIKLSDLTKRDVRDVTDKIMRRNAPTLAWHVFKDIRAILNWSIANDFLPTNPIAQVEAPGGFNVCDRTLTDDEIKTLWHVLPTALAKSVNAQRILKVCLITGCRLGEASGMTRGELDLKRKLWTMPGERVKNGHTHTVPLSDLALSVINEALADTERDAVFPDQDGRPLRSPTVTTAVLRAQEKENRFGIPHWSPHDLRRACLDNMARLGVLPNIIAEVANHRSVAKSGITFAHYIKHSFEAEKRAALDLWGDRLQAIIDDKAAIVVPMRGRP
jgi:integrase